MHNLRTFHIFFPVFLIQNHRLPRLLSELGRVQNIIMMWSLIGIDLLNRYSSYLVFYLKFLRTINLNVPSGQPLGDLWHFLSDLQLCGMTCEMQCVK